MSSALLHHDVQSRVLNLARHILTTYTTLGPRLRLYPVGAGGVPVVYALKAIHPEFVIAEDAAGADIFITDRLDPDGPPHPESNGLRPLIALVYGPARLPWDLGAEALVERMLAQLGDDPGRGGLVETPVRVAKAWRHWFSGYGREAADVLKTFEDGAEGVDELVLVSSIPVYSHCEHHVAPIFGVAHVGYIPHRRIVGLSKLSRVVDVFARRLQVQERLTNQVADALWDNLEPQGVGVVLECRHLCMESRGVQQQGTITTTSALRGCLKEEHEARSEFLQLIDSAHRGRGTI